MAFLSAALASLVLTSLSQKESFFGFVNFRFDLLVAALAAALFAAFNETVTLRPGVLAFLATDFAAFDLALPGCGGRRRYRLNYYELVELTIHLQKKSTALLGVKQPDQQQDSL